MPAILAALAEALGLLSTVYGILLQLRDLAAKGVKETIPYFVETALREAGITLAHPTWGLHAIHDDIAAIGTPSVGGLAAADVEDPAYAVYVLSQQAVGAFNLLDAKLDSVLSAIGDLPTPPTPPDTGDIADAVWQYPMVDTNTAQGLQEWAGIGLSNISYQTALPMMGAPQFTLEGPWNNYHAFYMNVHTPAPDWADIGADETILAWLQRTDTGNTWTADVNTGLPVAEVSGGGNWGHFYIRPSFTELPARAGQPPPPPSPGGTALVAPIWPGDALVTLGTPVALVDQLVVDELMDGVLIEVTTPPGKLGSYRLGGVTLDYGAGRIAFESDDGQLEMWQYLGFRDAIYTPKTMAHASKARLQVLGGAEGTVTPWTVS